MLVAWSATAQGYDKNYRRLSSGDLTVDTHLRPSGYYQRFAGMANG